MPATVWQKQENESWRTRLVKCKLCGPSVDIVGRKKNEKGLYVKARVVSHAKLTLLPRCTGAHLTGSPPQPREMCTTEDTWISLEIVLQLSGSNWNVDFASQGTGGWLSAHTSSLFVVHIPVVFFLKLVNLCCKLWHAFLFMHLRLKKYSFSFRILSCPRCSCWVVMVICFVWPFFVPTVPKRHTQILVSSKVNFKMSQHVFPCLH